MSDASTAIVWFRRDLRLTDQPALTAALQEHDRIVPVFIFAPDEEAPWEPGAASLWWLHHSLASLSKDLKKAGADLVIRAGASLATLRDLIDETGAEHVYYTRLYEPAILKRDKAAEEALTGDGIDVQSFNAALLAEPWETENKTGQPYKVFTPFWKALQASWELTPPLSAPARIPSVEGLDSTPLEELALLPTLDWAAGFEDEWQPGEAGALQRLDTFTERVGAYKDERDMPAIEATSRLSPHLHFGEISPQQIAWGVEEATAGSARDDRGKAHFLSEIGWREFAHHLLYHFPETTLRPLRPEFEAFPWRAADSCQAEFDAWCYGNTGIPMVDAGMRQLWKSGWMHNRVRMIVASFLTKNQLIAWQDGALWFWDTLVDASLASNTLGWQWTAGCGADAAPFFRIFNPVRQGEKFDADERYVRHWCPELEPLPQGEAHTPWASDMELDYPKPVADLGESRKIALDAYQSIKQN